MPDYRKLFLTTVASTALAVAHQAIPGMPGGSEAWAWGTDCEEYKPDRTLSSATASQTKGTIAGKGWGVNASGSASRATAEKRTQQALSPEDLASLQKVYTACLLYKDKKLEEQDFRRVYNEYLGLSTTASDANTQRSEPFSALTLKSVLPNLKINTGDRKRDREANKRVWKPCSKGDFSKCVELANSHLKYSPNKTTDAVSLLALMCKSRVANGRAVMSGGVDICALTAAHLSRKREQGLASAEELAQIRWFNIQSCRLAHPTSCSNTAHFFQTGLGGPKDPAKAIEYFQKACGLGHATSCFEVSFEHMKLKRLQTASTLASRACKLSKLSHLDCAESLLKTGKKTPDGLPFGVMLAGQVLIYDCQLKQAASCKRMGYLGLHGGYGATKAPEHGFAMMKEACFLGDGEACWACGSEIENGVNMGKRPDKKAAKYWYKRACSQGYQSGKDLRGRPVCKNR